MASALSSLIQNKQPLSSMLGKLLQQQTRFARPEQQKWASDSPQNALGQAVAVPQGATWTSARGKTRPIDPDNKLQAGLAQTKIVRVVYGHGNATGGMDKTYDYLANANVKVGQMVTPPVNHPVSGKLYNTLAKVVSTTSANSAWGQNTSASLASRGIQLKNVGRTNQSILPGYYTGWGRDATARDEALLQAKVSGDTYDYNLTKQAAKMVAKERKQAYEQRKEQRLLSMEV